MDADPQITADQQKHVLDLLRDLAPHLQWSAQISRRLIGARQDGLRNGALHSPYARALLDGNAIALQMNPAMESYVAAGVCNLIVGRKARLHKPEDTARISAVLVEGAKGRRTLPWPHVMSFEAPSRNGPNILTIEALEGQRTNESYSELRLFEGSGPPNFVLTMRVRNLLRAPAIEQIRVGLGLTPKQAEAVWSLINGENIEKQAMDRGLSVDGVRWHFKNIYQRTGCATQAELVRLVASLFDPAPP